MTVERMISMPIGIVVERRELNNRWQKYAWRPVAIIPGAPESEYWKRLRKGDGWAHYHAATLPLELHRRETEAYKVALSANPPSVYVVMREALEEAEHDFFPFLVTASPYEAQDYLDSGEDIVEGVPMDRGLVAWVQAFVDRHHVDQPFHKRKRKPYDPRKTGFDRPPTTPVTRGGDGSDDG
ncbi:MAG: DUF3305 domain-containing protein [Alphaproteobacteria bacterium]|nr:DUF3305 domain-containing protein [Alphaproteobacteria bacterium]